MVVKFDEYWNIIPDKWDEYVDFMQRSRIPTLNRLGINIVAIWCSLIGAGPQIISVGVSEDFEHCEDALKSDEYYETNCQLLHYVTDYRSKMLVSSGRFPQLPRGSEKGPVKFSQYWDIIPGKEKEYDQFIQEIFFPEMENLNIQVIGEWKVLIGESPNIFFETRADHESQLLQALTSQKFRILKNDLVKLVSNYSSRILMYHAFKSRKSKEYEFYLI